MINRVLVDNYIEIIRNRPFKDKLKLFGFHCELWDKNVIYSLHADTEEFKSHYKKKAEEYEKVATWLYEDLLREYEKLKAKGDFDE